MKGWIDVCSAGGGTHYDQKKAQRKMMELSYV